MSDIGHDTYSTNSVIEIKRSKKDLDDGILLEALITHTGILNGIFLLEKYVEIVNAHTVGYVEEDDGNIVSHLAVIRIPENFDGGKLQTSVDAAVSMMQQTVELQRDLLKAANQFKTERF